MLCSAFEIGVSGIYQHISCIPMPTNALTKNGKNDQDQSLAFMVVKGRVAEDFKNGSKQSKKMLNDCIIFNNVVSKVNHTCCLGNTEIAFRPEITEFLITI
jgi:hypothetical protein